MEEAKQFSLSKEDGDEIVPIKKLIKKHEVVDLMYKGKVKEQKVENKDQATSMDGEWAKTRMKKMIYGVVFPRVEHPTLVEKATVKQYSKNDMVHMMLKLEYVLPLLPNPKNTTCCIIFRFI